MAKVLNWKVTIFTSWKRYKKVIPAIAGFSTLILLKHLDIDVPGLAEVVLDFAIAAAGSFGVYQLKNEYKAGAITVETEVKKE